MTLRWQQAEKSRHALDADTRPGLGEEFRALCGAEVTVQCTDVLGGHWCGPACQDCAQVWREMDHLPANEVLAVMS